MSNNQELVMETTHGRSKKCKTEFKAVLNKVLVSGLVLATMLGTATPAFAAEMPKDNLNAYATSVAYSQGISVESVIKEIRNTIDTINEFRSDGSISDKKLGELANQLYELENAVKSSGNSVTSDVISILNEAEKLSSQFDSENATKVKVAVAVVKGNLGVDGVTVDNKSQGKYKTTSFDDIAKHWAKDSIMLCLQHGAVDGTKDADENGVSSFKPDENVTLGQFLAVITRLVAPEKIVEMPNQAHWAVPNYNAAVQSGIIKSSDFKSTVESLNTNLSRQDMAYILVGAAKVHGETLEIIPNVESLMGDYSSIPNTRQDAVKRAYSNGLLAGDTNGNFKPADPMTRGQMATVVCRLMEYTPRDAVSVDTNQVQAGDTIMGGYVSNKGKTQGMLLSEYSRKFELQALDGVRLGEDSTGVYVEFTAPQLPDEIKDSFTFKLNVGVEKSNGDLFATDANADGVKSGETVKVYFYSFASEGTKGITKNQIDNISVNISILNSRKSYMFVRKVNSTDKTHAVGVWYDGETEIVDYNSSAIFAGIGK